MSHKDVEEGGAVVVVKNFFIQFLLNPSIHLKRHRHTVTDSTESAP